jgi:uncharacterized protein YutE (UPF0331/DUF86 family)
VKARRSGTKEAFLQDLDSQDIVALNLERAVQACVDIASHLISYTPLPAAPTMADAFVHLKRAGIISDAVAHRMIKATGLRNLLVHEYQTIDWSIVWIVTEHHLSDLVHFTQEVLAWAASQEKSPAKK